MSLRNVQIAEAIIDLYEWDGARSRNVKVGKRTGVVQLQIDPEALLNMLGPKALANKSGRARIARGAVVVRVAAKKDHAL